MKVLIACEFSGVVRDAFRANGHDAWSCDLLPCEADPTYHIKGDVLKILDDGWDLLIAHPPCTYLANSGARWLYDSRYPNRAQDREEAAKFFLALYNANVSRVAVENPVGHMSRRFRKPNQIINPYQFGNEAQKATCLWLKNLPNLIPTKIVGKGEMHITKSGKVLPKWYALLAASPDRQKLRSITFPGIAKAMADQWVKPGIYETAQQKHQMDPNGI